MPRLVTRIERAIQWVAEFIKVYYHFIVLMTEDQGENFAEIKEMVEKRLKYEDERVNFELTLETLFPGGPGNLCALYAHYLSAKRFRTRMSRAGQFLHVVHQLDALGILDSYETLMSDLETDLKEWVAERASAMAGKGHVKPGDLERDLASLPDEFNLRKIYEDTFRDEPRDS
jgi:hypothetical protein